MITLEYLKEYEKKEANYTQELKSINRRINELSKTSTMDSVSGSSKRFPYEKKHYKVVGISENKIRKLENREHFIKRKIEKLKNELEYKLKRLSEEDSVLADIIRQKYIEKKEWTAIAMNNGYAGESGPRNYFNRCFNKK